MTDRVITEGGLFPPGQGCLASVTAADDPWIIEEVFGVDEEDAGVGAGTYYPVGLTEVDHLMELYWRWRTMRIDWNYTYDAGSGYDGSGYGSIVVDKTRTTGRWINPPSGTVDVTREAELVLSAPWLFEGEPFPDPESPPEGGYPGELVNGFVRIFAGSYYGAGVRYYNGKWYPSIVVDFSDLRLGDEELGLYAYDGALSSLGTAGTLVTGKLRLSGGTEYDLPLWIYVDAYTPSAFSFVIDALDYWPHKKVDGSPKYNTTTGLPI